MKPLPRQGMVWKKRVKPRELNCVWHLGFPRRSGGDGNVPGVYGKNASNMAENLGSYPLQSMVCTELSSVVCWQSVNTD